MKKTVLIVLVAFLAIHADGLSQKNKDVYKVKTDTVTIDSLEYKLIILDPGFEAWLVTKPSKNFYSKQYYEQKNRIYVSEWNYRYMAFRNNDKYETFIDYNPDTDYGLDLNYRLYYYFRYFEETNKEKLDPTGR